MSNEEELNPKHSFKTASIIPFSLPPFVQTVLNEFKFIPSAGVRYVFGKFPDPRPEDNQAFYDMMKDMVDDIRLMDKYAESIFYYRQKKITTSMYYAATFLGRIIENNPDTFDELPEDYEALCEEIQMLGQYPDKIRSAKITPNASFCYRFLTLSNLNVFLRRLQKGDVDINSEEGQSYYHNLVVPSYAILHTEDALSDDIMDRITQINFIVNYHDKDLCPYIHLGQEAKENSFTREELIDVLPENPSVKTRHVFDTAYNYFLQKHDEANHDFFYEISEKIMVPVMLLQMAHPDISADAINCLIAQAVYMDSEGAEKLLADFDPETVFLLTQINQSPFPGIPEDQNITLSDLKSISACIAICDLSFARMKIDGPKAEPLYSQSSIVALHEELEAGKDIYIENPHLKALWDQAKIEARECLNNFSQHYREAAAELGLPDPGPQ